MSPRNNDAQPCPGIQRRQFIKLAAMTGLLAGCGSLQKAATPTGTEVAQITPTTATTAPTTAPSATSTAAVAPTATSTAALAPTATLTTAPTAVPTFTAVPASPAGLVQVTFVKTDQRAEGVRKAIDLLGINPVSGKTVLLKPNLNSANPTPGSTHPAVLRAMVTKLQELGTRSITVGDRSGVGSTALVLQKLGVHDLGAELGFDVINFDRLHDAKDWVMVQPPDSHWKRGFPIPRLCLDAEAVVQTCCLKTHQFGGHFTMSLKNSVGMCGKGVPISTANFMDELHSSVHQRSMIAEINYAYEPALVVLDGVDAFTAGGPMTGRLASPQVVLASTDRIAIDAVGVALLRHFGTTQAVANGPIFEQEQIARAVELGLGVDRPERIQLVTDDPDSEVYAGPDPGDTAPGLSWGLLNRILCLPRIREPSKFAFNGSTDQVADLAGAV